VATLVTIALFAGPRQSGPVGSTHKTATQTREERSARALACVWKVLIWKVLNSRFDYERSLMEAALTVTEDKSDRRKPPIAGHQLPPNPLATRSGNPGLR
jgi:hypothetical protein